MHTMTTAGCTAYLKRQTFTSGSAVAIFTDAPVRYLSSHTLAPPTAADILAAAGNAELAELAGIAGVTGTGEAIGEVDTLAL